MSDKDVDAQFADIVAHWDDVPTVPDAEATEREPSEQVVETPEGPYAVGPGPAEPPPPPAPGAAADDPARPAVNPPFDATWPVWRGAPSGATDEPAEVEEQLDRLDDDDDEHFEPGPLAPLPPQEDLQFWGIIVGLVGGPLLLLWLVLFRRDVSDWWTFLALGLTAGGFVLLVMRQPHSRDEDDPDNGARV
jgi:hypothetical protein